MESYDDIIGRFNSGKIDKNEMELLIISLKKAEISSGDRNYKEESLNKSGIKALALKSSKFYNEKIGMSPSVLSISRKIYNQLHQFDYGGEEDADDLRELIKSFDDGFKRIYIGQFKPGTDIRDGIGISVLSDGVIYEGYFKDDKPNGYGRTIWSDGRYYIGNSKDDLADGYGEICYTSGNMYKGQWKDDKYSGEGEYRYNDGRVYRGKWDDNIKLGQGTMTYPDGTIKTGQWIDNLFEG